MPSWGGPRCQHQVRPIHTPFTKWCSAIFNLCGIYFVILICAILLGCVSYICFSLFNLDMIWYTFDAHIIIGSTYLVDWLSYWFPLFLTYIFSRLSNYILHFWKMARELEEILRQPIAQFAKSCISPDGVSFHSQVIFPLYDVIAAVSPMLLCSLIFFHTICISLCLLNYHFFFIVISKNFQYRVLWLIFYQNYETKWVYEKPTTYHGGRGSGNISTNNVFDPHSPILYYCAISGPNGAYFLY